jgi:UDP-N-acetylmuramoyl-L-alanyl-D-glutamate--2,6-diaminopimelate ligase
VDSKIGFTKLKSQNLLAGEAGSKVEGHGLEMIKYEFVGASKKGVKFVFDGKEVQLNILGDFNALNAAAASCVGKALGVDNEDIKKGLEVIKSLPGRLERINEGQNFTVIVDYAFEPVAVTKLYETIKVLEPNKIIHVLGSTGGGRDLSRRVKLGEIAGQKADYIIITNEDPYDDDPMEIIRDVANGAENKGKEKNKNLWLIEDRQEGIKKAISLAEKGDVVLITGKGSEQAIATKNGELVPWDDREVVREILKNKILK